MPSQEDNQPLPPLPSWPGALFPIPGVPGRHSGHGSQSTGRDPTGKSEIELEFISMCMVEEQQKWGTMSRAESAIDWGRTLTMQQNGSGEWGVEYTVNYAVDVVSISVQKLLGCNALEHPDYHYDVCEGGSTAWKVELLS